MHKSPHLLSGSTAVQNGKTITSYLGNFSNNLQISIILILNTVYYWYQSNNVKIPMIYNTVVFFLFSKCKFIFIFMGCYLIKQVKNQIGKIFKKYSHALVQIMFLLKCREYKQCK